MPMRSSCENAFSEGIELEKLYRGTPPFDAALARRDPAELSKKAFEYFRRRRFSRGQNLVPDLICLPGGFHARELPLRREELSELHRNQPERYLKGVAVKKIVRITHIGNRKRNDAGPDKFIPEVPLKFPPVRAFHAYAPLGALQFPELIVRRAAKKQAPQLDRPAKGGFKRRQTDFSEFTGKRLIVLKTKPVMKSQKAPRLEFVAAVKLFLRDYSRSDFPAVRGAFKLEEASPGNGSLAGHKRERLSFRLFPGINVSVERLHCRRRHQNCLKLGFLTLILVLTLTVERKEKLNSFKDAARADEPEARAGRSEQVRIFEDRFSEVRRKFRMFAPLGLFLIMKHLPCLLPETSPHQTLDKFRVLLCREADSNKESSMLALEFRIAREELQILVFRPVFFGKSFRCLESLFKSCELLAGAIRPVADEVAVNQNVNSQESVNRV